MMTNMRSGWVARAGHSRAYAGLFLLFLAFGLAAGLPIGRAMFRSHRSFDSQAKNREAGITQPATGQNSWLIVGVDNLQATQPHLQSVWLALTFPGKPTVTLLPLFPVPGADLLDVRFSLDQHDAPSAEFREALNQQRIWWNGYLVLDGEGFRTILNLFDTRGSASSQLPALEDQARIETGGDVSAIQRRQTSLLESACQQADGLLSLAEIEQLVARLATHLQTDLNLAQVARAWPLTEAGSLKIDCEFPMMVVAR